MITEYVPAGSFEENLVLHQDVVRLSSEQGIIRGHVNMFINREGQIIKPLARLPKNTAWTIKPSVKEVLDVWDKLLPESLYILYGATFNLRDQDSGVETTCTRYSKFKKRYTGLDKWLSSGRDWWFIDGPDSNYVKPWREEVKRLRDELEGFLKAKKRRLVIC